MASNPRPTGPKRHNIGSSRSGTNAVESLTAAVYGGEVDTAAETAGRPCGHHRRHRQRPHPGPERGPADRHQRPLDAVSGAPGHDRVHLRRRPFDDGTKTILERLAASDDRIRVIDNPARLTPHGLNLGLRHARGAFVARMDGHAHYPPDYLARGVRRLMRGDVAWVSGPQLPHGEGWWSSRVTLALGSSLGHGGSRRWQSTAAGRRPRARTRSLERERSVSRCMAPRHAARAPAAGTRDGRSTRMSSSWHASGSGVSAPCHCRRWASAMCLATRRPPWHGSTSATASSGSRPAAVTPRPCGPRTSGHRVSWPASWSQVRRGAGAATRIHWIRATARGTVTLYVGALLVATRRVARREAPADWVLVPAALAVMHLSWGAGFVGGCLRLGPPVQGLQRVGLNLRARIQPSAHAATAA